MRSRSQCRASTSVSSKSACSPSQSIDCRTRQGLYGARGIPIGARGGRARCTDNTDQRAPRRGGTRWYGEKTGLSPDQETDADVTSAGDLRFTFVKDKTGSTRLLPRDFFWPQQSLPELIALVKFWLDLRTLFVSMPGYSSLPVSSCVDFSAVYCRSERVLDRTLQVRLSLV